MESKVISWLRVEYNKLGRLGRPTPFEFNSSANNHVQGPSFIEGNESPELQVWKKRRERSFKFQEYFTDIEDRDLELLCSKFLAMAGVSEPVTTRKVKDGGIDFHGIYVIEKIAASGAWMPSVLKQLKFWIVGQAKHTPKSSVPEELVSTMIGAIEVARSRTSGDRRNRRYPRLAIRGKDPVWGMIITTGRFTADAWRLLDEMGFAGVDGEMLGEYLADNLTVDEGGESSGTQFVNWIRAK
jgi:hypothetical protein